MPVGLLLDVARRGGAQKPELGFARSSIGCAPALAVLQILRPTLLLGADQPMAAVQQPVGAAPRRWPVPSGGRSGVDRFAAGDHFDGIAQADDPRRAGGAAPAGKQPQLHFGKAELRFGVVGHDPPIAPDGQFGPAADANAVDRRHGDERQSSTAAANSVRPRWHMATICSRGTSNDGGELAQVGAGDERARLARANDQAGQVARAFPARRDAARIPRAPRRQHVGSLADRRTSGPRCRRLRKTA